MKALGDEVGREPLLPILVVAGVAHGRERDDPGIEPGISHVADARHAVAGLRIADLHQVDPRAMRRIPFEAIPPLDRTSLQLFTRTDDLELAGFLVYPNGQSEDPKSSFLEIIQSPMFLSQSSSRLRCRPRGST